MKRSSPALPILAAAVCAGALAAVPASGTTYYVATDGNDANDGLSAQSAFLTLSKAATRRTTSGTARPPAT